MPAPSRAGGLLGQLAVSRGLLTPAQLRASLEIASRSGSRPLGEVLVSQGLLTEPQLQALLAEQKAAPKPAPLGAEPPLEIELPEASGELEIEQAGASRVIGAPATSAPEAAVAKPEVARVPADGAKHLAELVGLALRAFASDLHLHPGYPVTIRQHGRVVAGNGPPLVASAMEGALLSVLSREARAELEANGEAETVFLVEGGQRCRVQLFRQAAGLSAVFRVVPSAPPSLTQLGLPGTLARYVTGQGLVLIAGPRGSGKTWTLAALVDLLNVERQDHIVCVERPIEFVHASKRCVVTQREVPTHAGSVSRAVRAALHEDPDVLVVGEIEDAETARLALQAAEGGRLVLATFPAAGAVRAVARLLGLFPSDQQGIAGAMLSGALRAVVGQRLVGAADGQRRAPVCELVDVDPAAAARIAQGRAMDLEPAVSLDEALAGAVRDGTVARDEARRLARDPEAIP